MNDQERYRVVAEIMGRWAACLRGGRSLPLLLVSIHEQEAKTTVVAHKGVGGWDDRKLAAALISVAHKLSQEAIVSLVESVAPTLGFVRYEAPEAADNPERG